MNIYLRHIKRMAPVLFALFVVSFSGCRGFDPTDPGSPPEKTYIDLPTFFLSQCGQTFEGIEAVRLDWNVDGINANGNPFSFQSGRVNLTNNDGSGPLVEQIEIQVPESGSYSVTVDVELTCSGCCNRLTTRQGPLGCTGIQEAGEPVFRGSVLMINQSPPVRVIEVNPVFDRCFSCGCVD